MRYLKILSFFIAFSFSFQANATHVMGADITYKAIDSLKYEISITYYRWCNGVGISNPSSSTKIRCISGGNANVSLSLKSITEITELCDTAPRRCNPANTYGTGEGVEKHVYTAIIDFTSSPYNSLVNCGTIIIETGQCCRNNSINTGASNSNFYTYAELVLSQSYNNSSPIFTSNPKAFLCCNQPAYLSVNAIDTVDYDSISYAWASPLSGYNSNIGYTGSNYAFNHPFKAYYPGNFAPPYRNANANPPIGITLDSKSGELIFTPTRCDEETVAVLAITEWRKDSSGVYQKIGLIRRDVQFITKTCPDNNPPTLNGPYEYGICEGNTLCFDITTNDIVYTPPPPASSPAPDSVQIAWNNGIPQATFTVINPDSLHQTGRFCWTPSAGSARTMPYSFVAKAKDNHCPNIATSYRNYNVFVTTKKTSTTNITDLNCGSFVLESNPDSTNANTAKYRWTLQDSNGKNINSSIYSFESTNGDTSYVQKDTVHIDSNGTYILTHQIEPLYGNCPTIYFDTISVKNAFSIGTTRKNEILCKGDSQIWVANAKGGNSPYSYTWIYKNDTSNSSSLTTRTTSYSENNTLILQVKEAGGCVKKLETIVKTHPNNSNGFLAAYSACNNDSIVLTIDSRLRNPVWNASTSSYSQTYKTDSILVVNYSDTFQCNYSDTIRVSFYTSPPTSLSDTNACTDSIRLTPGLFASYLWNTGDTSASIVANKNGLYWVQVWDRSNCTNTDTAFVTLNSKMPTPVIRLAHDTIFSNSIGKHYWHKDGNWISTTTNNFLILLGFGEYFAVVQDTNGCISDTSNRLKKTAGFEDVISSKLIVYPNPSNGSLTLKLASLSISDIKTIQLYTTDGKLVESTVYKGENEYYITWNSAPGMLWLVIQTDEDVYRREIVYLK